MSEQSDVTRTTDLLVEEVARLVWQEGHYSTPWEEWQNKDRWRSVARSILQTAERHLHEQSYAEGWDTAKAYYEQ